MQLTQGKKNVHNKLEFLSSDEDEEVVQTKLVKVTPGRKNNINVLCNGSINEYNCLCYADEHLKSLQENKTLVNL